METDTAKKFDYLMKRVPPVGTIISFFGTVAPDGYLICNGDGFDTEAYPLLYAVLGSAYLPNLAGKFLRGLGGNAAALGVEQGDATRKITGKNEITSNWRKSTSPTGPYQNIETYLENVGWGGINDGNWRLVYQLFDTSLAVPTADEIRPVNVAVLYCIKHD
jgi:hypothetical protein